MHQSVLCPYYGIMIFHYVIISHFIYQLMDIYIVSPLWLFMNNDATNICMQDFVWIHVLIFFGHMSRSRIPELHGKSVYFSEEMPDFSKEANGV